MATRKTLVFALVSSAALVAPAAAQNLLERATAPPRYEQQQQEEQFVPPPAPPRPKPQTATLPPKPGAGTPAVSATDTGKPGTEAAKPAATAPPEEPAPPYEPQLLRLSELLGALTYLQDLCGGKNGQIWRDKMTALMDAETQNETRRERLAGAYNRGFQGYELSYRQCTPNAQEIITRFLAESSKIARDVTHRYGTS